MKCELCGCNTQNIVEIKNKFNGNELKICRRCGAEWEDCKMLVDDEAY